MDNDLIDREFPLDEGLIYLNHAAVAPWPARTRDAVKKFAEENAASGARNYPGWMQKEAELRAQIQRLLNAPSTDDIGLLKNTSEALSVVAHGLEWKQGDNVVTSAEEFPSNRIPWQALSSRGVTLTEVDVSVDQPEKALMEACGLQTRVLTVSSVQYGSGLRLDLEQLGRFCKGNDILFCVDAIQSIGAIDMDVQSNQADFVMADGHKWMLGPEGIALFYSTPAARDKLQLHQFGWHMTENIDFNSRDWDIAGSARRFECGSPNMLGIHALSASLSLFEEVGMPVIQQRVLDNSEYLIDRLNHIPEIEVSTPVDENRHAGIINFTVEATDLDRLQRKLLRNNVICVHRGGGIRFSPHFYMARDILDKAVEILTISI